jgi:hypothetical protein
VEIVQRLGDGRTADPYRDILVIDERAPRFNQAVVAFLCVLALATGAWWLASLMGLQLIVGLTFGRRYCLTCVFYFEVVQPRFGEGPIEDARPPRFANILGASFLTAATLLHVAGLHTAGGVLIAMVAALATLAVTTGFCMGCWMYRVLSRFRGVRPGHHDSVDMTDFGTSTPSVIQFTHPLCSDCRELERDLKEREDDLIIVDVSERRDLAHKYHVDVVPLALRVSGEGRVLERLA